MKTTWDYRFIKLAREIATWSSCLHRQVGCVIVRDKRILTTGYNGAPSGVETCRDRNECLRDKCKIPSGQNLELCFAVHAEQNAIAQAAKLGLSLEGATLYCTHSPCSICAKLIINSGIKEVIYENDYPDAYSSDYFREAGVKMRKFGNQWKWEGQINDGNAN